MFEFLKKRKLKKVLGALDQIKDNINKYNSNFFKQVNLLYDVVEKNPVTCFNSFSTFKDTDGVLLFESSQIAADTIVTLINNKPTEVISQIMELKPLENNFYSWFSNSTSVNVYMRSLHELINFYVIHTKIEDGLVPTVAELNTLKSLSHLYYGLEPLLESYVFRHIFFEYMFIYRTLLISEISKE